MKLRPAIDGIRPTRELYTCEPLAAYTHGTMLTDSAVECGMSPSRLPGGMTEFAWLG